MKFKSILSIQQLNILQNNKKTVFYIVSIILSLIYIQLAFEGKSFPFDFIMADKYVNPIDNTLQRFVFRIHVDFFQVLLQISILFVVLLDIDCFKRNKMWFWSKILIEDGIFFFITIFTIISILMGIYQFFYETDSFQLLKYTAMIYIVLFSIIHVSFHYLNKKKFIDPRKQF